MGKNNIWKEIINVLLCYGQAETKENLSLPLNPKHVGGGGNTVPCEAKKSACVRTRIFLPMCFAKQKHSWMNWTPPPIQWVF